VFSPAAGDFGGTVDVQNILDFIDDGHSVLVAASPDVSEPVRELAAECGLEFDEKDAFVIVHFNYDVSDAGGEHSIIVADKFVKSAIILGEDEIAPVLFRGIGHAIVADDKDRLITEVLTGSSTSYSHVPTSAISSFPHVAGVSTLLVSALQARNGARVVFTGSIDMFSDEFFGKEAQVCGTNQARQAGNEEFAEELTEWLFHERGILRYRDVSFNKAGESTKPSSFRVEDPLQFRMVIEQWNGEKWVAYKADDVQLDFTMLDPHVRKSMSHDGKGLYTANFKVPDRYGVFQFKISYRRLGYTALSYAEQIPVTPFRHNEFERFIHQAFPYYTSAFSMLFGFLAFSVLFPHFRPAQ